MAQTIKLDPPSDPTFVAWEVDSGISYITMSKRHIMATLARTRCGRRIGRKRMVNPEGIWSTGDCKSCHS